MVIKITQNLSILGRLPDIETCRFRHRQVNEQRNSKKVVQPISHAKEQKIINVQLAFKVEQ